MRIEGKPVLPTPPSSPGGPAAAASPDARGLSEDAVQVSGAARTVAEAQQRIQAMPDVRMDRVAALQGQLDAGAYHPDGAAVAQGLIQEHLAAPRGA